MLNFGKLYDIISDEEKKSLITYLIKEIQIYPNGESEQPLKSIEFNFPIYRDGQEVRQLLWEKGNTVESVCVLEKKQFNAKPTKKAQRQAQFRSSKMSKKNAIICVTERRIYMLEIGIQAPDFELPDQDGVMHKLSDYKGKKVILYFYPKDNTAGCTKQACGFSERYPQFLEKGAVILGVSKDTVASHKKFQEKYGLAFTLLADPERKVIEAYDVWKEKKNYGKVSMGVVRTTYLIDESGIIVRANDKVKAANDAENMLEVV